MSAIAAKPKAAAPVASSPARSDAYPRVTGREWMIVVGIALALVVFTSLPYIYFYLQTPPDKQFMGLAFNIADHFQYFSWMRESQTQILVPNQLTPENSTPLLFNLLWWVLGRLEGLTGLDYAFWYQFIRVGATIFAAISFYFFASVVFTNIGKRMTATLIGLLAGGLGWLLVVEKYLLNIPDLNSPFAIYTSEPNTFFTALSFPHFSIAAALITLVLAFVLIGQKSKNLRYAWIAAALALLLSLQHAYDMFIIYPVIGLYALFIWVRDRRFPMYLFKLGLIVVLISMWPALQAYLITSVDEVWRGVLSQFDNAGAWTPAPWLLPILMGVAWLFAIWALDIKTPWKDRDDTHLFVMAWFLTHFIVIYLPLNFQIHLLSGWQVVGGVLATIALYRKVLPWLQQRFSRISQPNLVRGMVAAFLLIIIPTNLYLVAWRFLDLNRTLRQDLYVDAAGHADAEARYFLRTTEVNALNFIESAVTSSDVVMSTHDIGQYIPALTGARSFIGHWAQTLDFYGKRDMVEAFFNPATPDSERQRILDEFNIRYVLMTPEAATFGYDPHDAPYLTEVFAEGSTFVFEVNAGA
jgi:hypothetical protein